MSDDLFKNKYRISSTRLKGWDYSKDGYYFVTICVKKQECLFGRINKDKMICTEIGRIACKYWQEIPEHFPFVRLDEYVVMPNHVHGIVVIDKSDDVTVETQDIASHTENKTQNISETQNFASLHQRQWNTNKFGPQSNNLASIIRGFKIGVKKFATTNDIIFEWQPRYYERIIRNGKELMNVRNYIRYNPSKWYQDEENPEIKK